MRRFCVFKPLADGLCVSGRELLASHAQRINGPILLVQAAQSRVI